MGSPGKGLQQPLTPLSGGGEGPGSSGTAGNIQMLTRDRKEKLEKVRKGTSKRKFC